MSSILGEQATTSGLQRLRRPAKRALFWVGRLKKSPGGDPALSDMWRWLRKEISELEDKRPEAAEAARWHAARQIGFLTAPISQAKIALRAGITEDEERQLLDPWGKRNEVSR
jgi:hypothetical protein